MVQTTWKENSISAGIKSVAYGRQGNENDYRRERKNQILYAKYIEGGGNI